MLANAQQVIREYAEIVDTLRARNARFESLAMAILDAWARQYDSIDGYRNLKQVIEDLRSELCPLTTSDSPKITSQEMEPSIGISSASSSSGSVG